MPRIRNAVASLFIGSVLLSTTAHADLVNRWSVGTGDALASIQFDFSDGDTYEYGDGSEPPYVNYWHYWTRESSSSDWESSMIGFGSRILSDGAEDAWVFGSNAAPSVVPLPGTLALFAGGLMLRRRRCRDSTTDQR